MEVRTDIPMTQIKKTGNIRNENVDIADLKNSIEQHGLLQPIVVSKHGQGFKIVAGHRRFMACKALGHKQIPAVVQSFKNPAAIQITENVQRSDMSKQEESKAVYDLWKKLDCTKADMSRMLGKDPMWITKRLAFHEVRAHLIKESFSSKSVAELTFDIAVRMGRYGKKDWDKMAAASLGKRWYPEQLDTLFHNIAHPDQQKKSNTKGAQAKKALDEGLGEEAFEFSIDADDGQCMMKLMFVSKAHYLKVKDSLIAAGGEII